MTENKPFWEAREKELETMREKAARPGGQKAVDNLAKRGKRPVRELITDLIDADTPFFELSMLAG
ncbi:MAG: hypothetical protein ABR513_03155 [Desulfotignum sp.]